MSVGGIGKSIVVIATYNEADNIAELLDALPYSTIVIDDNSPDDTGAIARKCGALVVNRPAKGGIASAYFYGFLVALEKNKHYIVQMDAGLTHKPCDVPRLIGRAKAGYDLVIGSRFMTKVPVNSRSTISRTAATMFSLLNIPVQDATSGFRCWNAELLAQVISKPFEAQHFAFQLETLYRAHTLGAKITEVPIQYRLTSSSFKMLMLGEALRIYTKLLWGEYVG